MPEASEYQFGEWHIGLKPHAMLIARAPSLRDAVAASLAVFRAMAEHGMARGQLAAQDMIPSLECPLFGLETAGLRRLN
jgi:hypothetical protein